MSDAVVSSSSIAHAVGTLTSLLQRRARQKPNRILISLVLARSTGRRIIIRIWTPTTNTMLIGRLDRTCIRKCIRNVVFRAYPCTPLGILNISGFLGDQSTFSSKAHWRSLIKNQSARLDLTLHWTLRHSNLYSTELPICVFCGKLPHYYGAIVNICIQIFCSSSISILARPEGSASIWCWITESSKQDYSYMSRRGPDRLLMNYWVMRMIIWGFRFININIPCRCRFLAPNVWYQSSRDDCFETNKPVWDRNHRRAILSKRSAAFLRVGAPSAYI